MLFRGIDAEVWEVTLTGDVTSSIGRFMTPGRLYTFIVIQDNVGNHAFPWPVAAINGTPVDQTPNSVTVQNFIGGYSGRLDGHVPGTWFEVGIGGNSGIDKNWPD